MTVEERKKELQKISWEFAPKILQAAGISKEDDYYALRQYEMQFSIYQNLKDCHKI